MKTCIYVFSGTGTCLSIANKLSSTLSDAKVRLIPQELEQAKGEEIKNEATTVGFVFPNYFGGIPDIVSSFIDHLNLDKSSYIFAIVSAGGGQGYGLKLLEEGLSKKGKKLNYGKYVTGISNYIVAWYYKYMCKTGEQRTKVLDEMDQEISQYSADIVAQKNIVQKSQYISYKLSHLLTPQKVMNDTRPWDREFSIDDKCIGCKTCEKVCQVKNITMTKERPVFLHNCQRCMACIQYCPIGAIRFHGKSLNQPRYFHPNYPAKEFIRAVTEQRLEV